MIEIAEYWPPPAAAAATAARAEANSGSSVASPALNLNPLERNGAQRWPMAGFATMYVCASLIGRAWAGDSACAANIITAAASLIGRLFYGGPAPSFYM